MRNTLQPELEIIDLIHDITGILKSEVQHDSNLETDLHMDSLDLLSLKNEIEKRFEMEIPSEKMEMIKTVNDLNLLVVEILNPIY